MRNIFITGCNRGLGLEFVKQLVTQQSPPKNIIATCRNLEKAEALQEISRKHSNVHLIQLDVTNFQAYEGVSKNVGKIVGDDGLNILINNAGVATKFTRLNMLKPEQMIENFTINTVGPLMLSKALYPYLKQAASKSSSLPMSISKAVVVNVSSVLGSIQNNTDGGFYPYRCSKAALNAATRSMSLDFKSDGVMSISLHPGWVQTDMGGSKAPLKVDESISSILATLMKLGPENNGTFMQYDGTSLPW